MEQTAAAWAPSPAAALWVPLRRATMNATRSLRKGGTVVLVGNLSPTVALPLQDVVSREISVLGSCASSGEIPECIELLASGAVDVDPIISLTAPLADGPALFERLYQGDATLMKVIIQP